jgi:hypothetical protein
VHSFVWNSNWGVGIRSANLSMSYILWSQHLYYQVLLSSTLQVWVWCKMKSASYPTAHKISLMLAGSREILWLVIDIKDWNGSGHSIAQHRLLTRVITKCTNTYWLIMKSPIFWDKMLCSLLKVSQHYVGTCFLQLQYQRISQTRNQHEAGSMLAGFL